MVKSTIIIRKAELADLEAIREIYNKAILTCTATFDTEPKTAEERLHLNQSTGFILTDTLKEVGQEIGKRLDVHLLQKMLT